MKRVTVFWNWNDQLDAGEIKRQIAGFHEHGVDGFFLHIMTSEFRNEDFHGGMPGYLTEEFFRMVQVAVTTAAGLDMDVWLYDESGWPSGILNGYFKEHRPDLMHRQIDAAGKIHISGDRPDLLNPETTAVFIQKTHEKYREYTGSFFGSTIKGIFTDEPYFGSFNDRTLPFSPVLEKTFAALKHYSARKAAARILNEHDEKAIADYNEVWLKLIRESYLLPIRKWCHKYGILSTGHFNGDDCIKNMKNLLAGDLFALHDCLDIPGCDAIRRQIHPLKAESDFSRLTSSAARGKRTISETFAVYGPDLSLAEMKQIAAMQFVSGIEMISLMAVNYSDRAARQVTTMSGFSAADPRWQNYRHFAGFIRRMSKLFDRTSPVIKASVPLPTADLRTGKTDPETIFPAGLALAARQITYDYSPDAGTLPENIVTDVALLTPVPMLRTRHLKSLRGERRLFVNAGKEAISAKFTAPAGFNAWYDPGTGKHFAATADESGYLTLDLPFAGVMVLLTIPGDPRLPESRTSSRETVKIPLEFHFDRITRCVKASPEGLIEVPAPASLPDHFCGTVSCRAQVELPQAVNAALFLPGARRAMCALEVNGASRMLVWPPYRWQLSLPAGKVTLTLTVANTPAEAIREPSHLKYLRDNGFDNVYFHCWEDFEPLFPDESPLEGAYLEY